MNIDFKSLYMRHVRMIPGIKSYALAAFFIFVLGITITLLSWYVDRQRLENQRSSSINQQAEDFTSDIKNRLGLHEQVLRGASGLFGASDLVTMGDWQRFFNQYDIDRVYPGLAGIAYAKHVPLADVDKYNEFMRTQGVENFKIMPEGVRPVYAPITYIEPLSDSGRRFIGYDILPEKLRLEPAEKARDTGRVTLSKRLVLLSDRGVTNQPGYGIYIAVYKDNIAGNTVEERRANLSGYIFGSIRAKTFFEKAVDRNKFKAFHDVQVFDGNSTDPKDLLYESGNLSNLDSSKFSQTFTTIVQDQPWTFRFANPVQDSAQDVHKSNMILVGGFTISFALAGFVFLLMFTRARAIVYSKQNEAQQAKDDLLSLASHQLRTPATAVKQYLGMILEGYTGEVDKKQLPALQKAYASNERQLETINQILYVAKADAGRLSIHKAYFDLNLLIDEIALDMEDALHENGQTIVVERSKKKLKVYGDEASIRMVIENLVSNASKYSYNDAQITIKTGVENQYVYVSVSDQGVGIAHEDFDKLFKKFSRIDNDLSLQVSGSGIGLYIDKVLVELHGGKIEVDSVLGEGSTFTVYLPKVDANNLTDGEKNNGPL